MPQATMAAIAGLKWGQMYAASSAAVLPIIIFVMAIQKYLDRGLTLGAVKG